MAIKLKTTFPDKSIDRLLKKIKDAQQPLSKKDYKQLGRRMVAAMKILIRKGISPVRGGGFKTRFPGYKDSYKKQIRGQLRFITTRDGTVVPIEKRRGKKGKSFKPDPRFKNKKVRPVNLKLSGDFLGALDSKVSVRGRSVKIGYFDRKQRKKEKWHREGAGGQLKRPTIPNPPEEKFAAAVMDVFRRMVRKRLKEKTKRKN